MVNGQVIEATAGPTAGRRRDEIDLNGNSSSNYQLTTASPTDIPQPVRAEPAAPAVKGFNSILSKHPYAVVEITYNFQSGIIRNYVRPVEMNLEDPEVRKRKVNYRKIICKYFSFVVFHAFFFYDSGRYLWVKSSC